MEELIEFARPWGTPALIFAGFLKLFSYADANVHPDFRMRFSKYLLADPADSNSRDWGQMFVELFETFFGSKLWSWKFAKRSTIASILCVIFMTIICAIVNPEFFGIFEGFDGFQLFSLLQGTLMLALFYMMLNLIPDLLSLAESRIIIHWMIGKSFRRVCVLLMLDLTLTSVIVIMSMTVFVASWDIQGLIGYSNPIRAAFWLFLEGLMLDSQDGIVGIFIYTTYFTSIWVWLCAISVVLMKTKGFMRIFRRILPVEESPFKAVGIVTLFPLSFGAMIVQAL